MDLVALAFLGDAVYELKVRRELVKRKGTLSADKLHLEAVRYVKASAQAKALRAMIKNGDLSEEESDVVRRARNRKPKSIPKNADPLDYKLATALEALFGFHYESGNYARVDVLAELTMRIIDE